MNNGPILPVNLQRMNTAAALILKSPNKPLAERSYPNAIEMDFLLAGPGRAFLTDVGMHIEWELPLPASGGGVETVYQGHIAECPVIATSADDRITLQIVGVSSNDNHAQRLAGAFAVIDQILLPKRGQVTSGHEALIGYLSHALTRTKGRARAALLADLAAVVADGLRE